MLITKKHEVTQKAKSILIKKPGSSDILVAKKTQYILKSRRDDIKFNMPESKIKIYQLENGQTEVRVRFDNETVWLTQTQMVELFQATKQNISLHIRNIFNEGELQEISIVKDYLTAASDGKRYNTKHYILDLIIAVGYRVNTKRSTKFRIWATQTLKKFIIKGFVLDDEQLKQRKRFRKYYFDELPERIREIRASERRFYQKITDIYALSADYDKTDKLTMDFCARVQNKLHWAITGKTAAELKLNP